MNSWIKHVKAYQAKHGCSYKDALKGARTSYKKGGGMFDDLLPKKKEPEFDWVEHERQTTGPKRYVYRM